MDSSKKLEEYSIPLKIRESQSAPERELGRDRSRRILSFFTSFVVAWTALANKTFAKAEWSEDPKTGAIECVHTDDQSGKKERLRLSSVKELGLFPALLDAKGPLIDALQATDVKMPYVNETIQDPAEWKQFVWSTAKEFGADYTKRSHLTTQEALELSIKIMKSRVHFSRKLDQQNIGDYDAALTAKIDATPIDVVVQKEGIGVCRHFSAGLDKVYEVFSQDPGCLLLKQTFLRKLITNDGYHAINIAGAATTTSDGTTEIRLGSIDTSVGKSMSLLRGADLDQFNIKKYEEVSSKREVLVPFYTQYLDPIFSPHDRLDTKNYFFQRGFVAHSENIQNVIELAFVSLGALDYANRKGEQQEAHTILNELRTLIREQVPQFDQQAGDDEYDLLYSVIFNIYRQHADAQKNESEREVVLHEGYSLRTHSLSARYEALLKKNEFSKALRTGEDYADFMAQAGDPSGAETMYHTLFDLYQKQKGVVGTYERSMPPLGDDSPYALFIKIEPFKDQVTLQTYLEYKKQKVWPKK